MALLIRDRHRTNPHVWSDPLDCFRLLLTMKTATRTCEPSAGGDSHRTRHGACAGERMSETRSRSRERSRAQRQGCGFSLFSSCSALLSAAKSGEPRDAARADFSYTSRRLRETRNARLRPAACFSPVIYREIQGRARRLRTLPMPQCITTSTRCRRGHG